MGYRWGKRQGKWNMKFEDGRGQQPYDPRSPCWTSATRRCTEFTEFGLDKKAVRGVPVRYVETTDGAGRRW
jgi:nitrate reductase alpha subunit